MEQGKGNRLQTFIAEAAKADKITCRVSELVWPGQAEHTPISKQKIHVQNSNPTEMALAILHNLMLRKVPEEEYPTNFLKQLSGLFTRPVNSGEGRASLELIVHMTQMTTWTNAKLVECITAASELKPSNDPLIPEIEEILRASTVIAQSLKAAITKVSGKDASATVTAALQNFHPLLTPVDVPLPGLRGFSGGHCAYINTTHFQRYQLNEALKGRNATQKLDEAVLAIHQLAHVILRLLLEDFNLNTPTVRLTDCPFLSSVGECELFNEVQPDIAYAARSGHLTEQKAQEFWNWLTVGKSLPKFNWGIFTRQSPPDGFDFEPDIEFE